MLDIAKFLFDDIYLDEISGVLGLFITIFGFFVTIINLRKTKSAAQQASLAVQQMKDSVILVNTLSDVSASIIIMDEIKRLHRAKSWEITLDRYASLRRNLVSIRHSALNLNDDHKKSLQLTIQYLVDMESMVEKNINNGVTMENIAKMNKTLSARSDEIHQLLLDLKAKGN